MRVAFLSPRFPHRFFRANVVRLSLSSRCFLPRFLPLFLRQSVGCSTPNMPRLHHRRHFCLIACALRASLVSSLRVPLFPRRRYTVPTWHSYRGKPFGIDCWAASPPVDAVVIGKVAPSASTSSRIKSTKVMIFFFPWVKDGSSSDRRT